MVSKQIELCWKCNQCYVDVQMNFFSNIGVYVIANCLIWIFRIVLRILPHGVIASRGEYLAFWAFLIPYFAGIVSTLSYIRGKKSFKLYNSWFQSNRDGSDSSYGTNFTGECDCHKFHNQFLRETNCFLILSTIIL